MILKNQTGDFANVMCIIHIQVKVLQQPKLQQPKRLNQAIWNAWPSAFGIPAIISNYRQRKLYNFPNRKNNSQLIISQFFCHYILEQNVPRLFHVLAQFLFTTNKTGLIISRKSMCKMAKRSKSQRNLNLSSGTSRFLTLVLV